MNSWIVSTRITIHYLKESVDIVRSKSSDILKNCIDCVIFPSRLKLADISPTFKANDSTL